MKKYLVLFNVLCYAFVVRGQNYSPTDFSLYSFPDTNSPASFLDTTLKSFAVSIEAGQLKIFPSQICTDVNCKITEGELLAVNLGEWGGGLYFKPADSLIENSFGVNGKSAKASDKLEQYITFLHLKHNLIHGKYLLLSPGNTTALLNDNGSWLFTIGSQLSHCALLRLTVKGKAFTIQELFSLDTTPMAMTMFKNTLFIATTNSLYRVEDGKIKQLFSGLFWRRLYPNSIAVENQRNLYVGMRAGYAKVDLANVTIQFFRYNSFK